MLPDDAELSVSVGEFVALMNQTLEYVYPNIVIEGELANFRVSKNRWVYFDLKDDEATVRFFGTVYMLPGPLEDGMILKVRGQPRLHPQYNFSVNVMSIQPAGEGTIRRAAELLQAKLTLEGLFDDERKRAVPRPPASIGLVASRQSAAYADFIKILSARWQGIQIQLIDVQVQGEIAPLQITKAIEQFNEQAVPPDVLVVIRGGGSAEDLAAFSTEQVTRAVAASRVPTVVAIGHEVDLSLAELAADLRASTPSNAAELLVPDRAQVLSQLQAAAAQLEHLGGGLVRTARAELGSGRELLSQSIELALLNAGKQLKAGTQLLEALSPQATLQRGYAIVRDSHGKVLRQAATTTSGVIVDIQFSDRHITAVIQSKDKE